ncbi:hypothetical protein H2198_007939 [Neophaeococcomyces mojaviensis]|uniref:Uncharacterized protein n=1 Tax=Neophaeococcomyces mojaviensis TaxID=3383035 RepID=A0ACC2ZYS2_9EURO|nr:hypothetical protein H2198_007939 [Knufia sp. JES_112]
MNHATSIATRFLGLCSHRSLWHQPNHLLRQAILYRGIASTICNSTRVQESLLNKDGRVHSKPTTSYRTFATSRQRCFRPSFVRRRLKPYHQTKEPGLTFRKNDLNESEIAGIFGEVYPEPELGNRILKVLHARRVDGTLDVAFDEDLTEVFATYSGTEEAALKWLRATYPVDEDAAIIARFQREESSREQEHPSALMERGQKLGLIKYQDAAQVVPDQQIQEEPEYTGPQSGRYYAPLSDKEGDVFGRSKIEEIRAKNEAEWEDQERKLQEEIDKSMAEAEVKHQEKSQAIAARPEQGVEVSDGNLPVRPPNDFEKWIIRANRQATSKLTLDSPEVIRLSTAGRILPSLLFVLAGCAGLYLWAQYWEPPRRTERIFPNTSLAYATCGGLIAANVLVFLLWRFPPMVGFLNRYFIVTPAYPRMFSMLGNTFSHQTLRHLVMNMVGLLVFGPRLHEDVGRANFIAIWVASGLIGSVVSLASFAARGVLISSSLGSSGCNWGIVGAYLWLHKDDTFSFIFLPEDWKRISEAKGYVLLPAFVVLDTVMALMSKQVDLAAHLTGMIVGVLFAEWYRSHDDKFVKRKQLRVSAVLPSREA